MWNHAWDAAKTTRLQWSSTSKCVYIRKAAQWSTVCTNKPDVSQVSYDKFTGGIIPFLMRWLTFWLSILYQVYIPYSSVFHLFFVSKEISGVVQNAGCLSLTHAHVTIYCKHCVRQLFSNISELSASLWLWNHKYKKDYLIKSNHT